MVTLLRLSRAPHFGVSDDNTNFVSKIIWQAVLTPCRHWLSCYPSLYLARTESIPTPRTIAFAWVVGWKILPIRHRSALSDNKSIRFRLFGKRLALDYGRVPRTILLSFSDYASVRAETLGCRMV